METVGIFIKVIFRCSSLPLEIFMRHHFGTRYLSLPRLIFSFLVLWAFWAIDTNFTQNPYPDFWNTLFFHLQASPVLSLFFLGFWPMAIYQKVIAFKSSEKEDEHSGSIGISFFGQRHLTFIIIEPAICLTLAALVYLADPQRALVTVVWLIIAALDFFFGALRRRFRDRKIRLNIKDAQITAKEHTFNNSLRNSFSARILIQPLQNRDQQIRQIIKKITAEAMHHNKQQKKKPDEQTGPN